MGFVVYKDSLVSGAVDKDKVSDSDFAISYRVLNTEDDISVSSVQ